MICFCSTILFSSSLRAFGFLWSPADIALLLDNDNDDDDCFIALVEFLLPLFGMHFPFKKRRTLKPTPRYLLHFPPVYVYVCRVLIFKEMKIEKVNNMLG